MGRRFYNRTDLVSINKLNNLTFIYTILKNKQSLLNKKIIVSNKTIHPKSLSATFLILYPKFNALYPLRFKNKLCINIKNLNNL